MAKIGIKKLFHSYSPTPMEAEDYVLSDLSINWRDGGAYALLGPSGCGKSTLLRILSGLLAPTQGRVFLDDEDVTRLTAQQRNIAKVFQFPVVYETLSTYENLGFPLKNRRLSPDQIAERVKEIAELLDLTGQLDKKAGSLSTDAKQLVALGRGLVRSDVSAILFDEPLTVIDPQKKRQLRIKLKRLHKQFGITMIYVTHDQTEALSFADTVMVMNQGQILQSGSPRELFEQPKHTFVGQFIGSPGMNLIPCQVRGNQARVKNQVIRLNQDYNDSREDQPLTLGIRPEFVRFSCDERDIPARLISIKDAGHKKIAQVRALNTEIYACVPTSEQIPQNNLHLRFELEQTHVYKNDALLGGQP